MQKTNKKARHWAVIVYPESAPKDWIEVIEKTGCAFAISPLHDSDFNESTGEQKKEHWHVIISYSNTTTFNNVKQLCDDINAPHPQAINSVKGAIRYFTHKDNPDKAQYSDKDIKCYNGFDIEEYNQLTVTQKYEIKHQICDFIRENEIFDYIDLEEKLYALNYDWYKVAVDNTYFFNIVCNNLWKKRKGL